MTKKMSAPSKKPKVISNPQIIIPTDRKESVSVAFIGHVDAGKSTTSGHIMLLNGQVDQRLVDKYKSEAENRKMETWYLSYLMDTSEEERARGKTVMCGHGLFRTNKRDYFIVDAPGHQSYIQEMISGSSYAELAILIISARQGEFESGFEKGGQTAEHALLVRTMGVQKIVCFVNKLDSVDWSQERFDYIKTKIHPYLKSIGFPKNDIHFIPGSGYKGINLIENNGGCPWYNGLALLPLLDSITLSDRQINGPVRMVVGDSIKEYTGTIYSGKILAGSLMSGHAMRLMPNDILVTINNVKLEVDDSPDADSSFVALAGETITFNLAFHSSESAKHFDLNSVRSGSIMCSPDSPVNMCKQFYAQFKLLSDEVCIPGFKCIMHLLSETREITLERIVKVVDKKKGDLNPSVNFVKPGQIVKARFSVNEPIVVEEFQNFPMLSRFNLRQKEETIGVGKVILIPKKEKSASST